MINVQYFASVRETLGCDQESLALPEEVETVAQLIDHLVMLHGEKWRAVLQESNVLVAVNQTMARQDTCLGKDDEVAFFPPVTGG